MCDHLNPKWNFIWNISVHDDDYYYQSQYEIWEWIQMQPTKPHCFIGKKRIRFSSGVCRWFFSRVDSCGVIFSFPFLSFSNLNGVFFCFGKLNYYEISTRHNQCRMGRGKSYNISPIFSSCTLNALNWNKKMFPILLLTQKRSFFEWFFVLCVCVCRWAIQYMK